MAEDITFDPNDLEQLRCKVADMFDNPPAGRDSPNGRRITIEEVFGSNPSYAEQLAFYDVEIVYYGLDPTFDNPLCYWKRVPRTQEEVDQLNAKAMEGDALSMLIVAQNKDRMGEYEAAITWFKRIAETGSIPTPTAYVRIGEYFLAGDGVERDPEIAVQSFELAIDIAADSIAMLHLGRCYIEGLGVEKDVEKGLSLLERSARQGNSNARYYLGLLYRDGKVVEQDFIKALKWYELSAWGYNKVSFTDLINLLLSTESPEKALVDRALFWAKLYYDRGEPRAYYIMGRFYQDGLGVEQDKEKGEKLLRKAADMDDSYAAYHLSNMLYETDKEASMEYFKKAVSLGYSGAEFEYGTMIWDEDRSRATAFIMSAVSKGFQPAIDFAYEHDLLPKE